MKAKMDDQTSYIHLSNDDRPPKLVLLAGGGAQTELIAKECQSKARPYFILGIKGSCDPAFVKKHPHAFVGMGGINTILRHFKRTNAEEVMMVGQVERPDFSDLKLDWRGLWWVLQYEWFNRGTNKGDDSLLSFLARKIESKGYKVVGARDVLSDQLVEHKNYSAAKPTSTQMKSIELGFDAAKELGKKDIGQGVIVHEDNVLLEECSEGTKAMIERNKTKGAILVKACKPQQNKNIDLPTIGLDTVEQAISNKLSGIAIEANDGFFFQQDEAIKRANKAGLFVVGIKGGKVPS